MFYLKQLYCGDYWDCIAKSGIYKITFVGCEHCYVGSACSFKSRWGVHRYQLTNRRHPNCALQRAWEKYGGENIRFTILEIVTEKSRLIPREQFWLDNIRPIFNFAKKAGSQLGLKHTDASKAKMAVCAKGRPKSPETIAKWKESMIRVNGFAATPQKIAKLTGQKRSPEVRKKFSALRMGVRQTQVAIDKMAATKRSQKLKFIVTPEWLQKIRASAHLRELNKRIIKYGYSPTGWVDMDLNAKLRWKRANLHRQKS